MVARADVAQALRRTAAALAEAGRACTRRDDVHGSTFGGPCLTPVQSRVKRQVRGETSTPSWLERAADLHADGLVYAAVHPALRSLHGQRRFGVVLDRVGAPAGAVRITGQR